MHRIVSSDAGQSIPPCALLCSQVSVAGCHWSAAHGHHMVSHHTTSVYMDTIPIVRCPEVVSVSGYASMNDTDTEADFKSEFAKQLEQSLAPSVVANIKTKEDDKSMARLTVMLQQNEDLRRAKEEFMKMKQENLRLKYQIEKQKMEEERYQKLQFEVEHLTNRLHKMEENRQAYEELTEQLGSYISLFSTQIGDTQTLSRSYSNLQQHGHVYRDTCTLPRTRVLPRGGGHDSSLDTSDADSHYRSSSSGFLSLPRQHHPRYKHHSEKFRYRSKTLSSRNVGKEINTSPATEDLMTKPLEIPDSADINKKKSSLALFLTRVKIFLLKKKKYDFQTLV